MTLLEAAYDKGKSANTFEVIVSAAPDLPMVKAVASDPKADASDHSKGLVHLTLSKPSAIDLDIPYAVQGTAIPGVDYVPLTGTVTIKAGNTSQKVYIVALKGSGAKEQKVVELMLEDGTGYTVATHEAVSVKVEP